MTTKDLIRKLTILQGVLETPEVRRRVCVAGITEIHSLASNRIFKNGIATDGTSIGTYSTKATSIGNIPGAPKVNGGKFKNGKKRKTKNYPGGYRQYRGDIGRENAFVNLDLTGSMRAAYDYGVSQNGKCAIGFTSTNEAIKMDGNEKRFGKIVAVPTQLEIQKGIILLRKEMIDVIKDIRL